MVSLSGNVGLDSGAFLLTTELFECAVKLQDVQLLRRPTSALALVGMLIGDN